MKSKIENNSITVEDLTKEDGDWNNYLNATKGKDLEVYMAVIYNNNVVILTGENVKVPQGNEEKVEVSYSNENKTFTLNFKQEGDTWIEATYNSVGYELGINISASGEFSGNSGLTVEWNGKQISEGTIEIEEGCGYSLLAYIDGKAIAKSESLFVDIDKDSICNAGFSPDNKKLEIYLTSAAKVGDECIVSVGRRDDNPPLAEFKVKVVAGITLNIGNNKIVKNDGTINVTSKEAVTAQILYRGKHISTGYMLKSVGQNAVYSIVDNSGNLTITAVGNGTNRFTIGYNNKEYTFNYAASELKDDENGVQNFKLKLTDDAASPMVKEVAAGETTYFMVGKRSR